MIFFYNRYTFSIHIICYKVKETHEFLSKFFHSTTQAKGIKKLILFTFSQWKHKQMFMQNVNDSDL